MIRLFVAVLDVLLLTMLVTFAVDAQDRRAVPQKRWLLAAAVTWLLLAIATVLDSDPLYILVMAAYVLVCDVSLTTQARLRTLVATAFLTLIAGFPLNVIVFVLNVLGVDIVFGHDHALYALAALMNVLVIFWVWRQRRRFSDQLAIRFSIGECLMIVVLFLLTTLLGLVMNPTNGELDPNVLATASGQFLVTMLTALVIFLNVFFLVMVVLPGVLHSLGDFLVKKRNRVRHAEGLHLRRGFQHALDPLVGLAAVVDEKVAAAYLYDVLCGGIVAVALLTGLEQHLNVRCISENLPRKVIRRKYRHDDLQIPAAF